MNMQLRYRGGFNSVNNIPYDVEIWQDGFSGKAQEVAFGENPLEIEWPETDKLEPVQSSRATLNLFSDTDRQFMDLYTVSIGNIRMDVYRNKVLYWSGTLDPELYEEPFAYKERYGVSLTFSDLAILERLNWNASGFLTLRSVIEIILGQTGIHYKGVSEYISTNYSYSIEQDLTGETSVNASNFYDEDGEPMTLREVLDETLRPFCLRLQQKAGNIVIYDLNCIYTAFEPAPVSWEADDAVLGVDKIYNNIKVTFSPYFKNRLLEGKVDPDGVGNELAPTVSYNFTDSIDGFKINLSEKGNGFEKGSKARYFRIEPLYSGDESAGVAWTVKVKSNNVYHSYLNEASPKIGGMLLKPDRAPYLAYTSFRRMYYKLRITLDMMADVRSNPFEPGDMRVGKSYPNEDGDFGKRLKEWCSFAYVPFRLVLRDQEGKAISHYENKHIVSPDVGYDKTGYWRAGEGAWGDAFFAYYHKSDREKNTGLGGWQTNRQCIGCHIGGLPTLFDKRDTGEYIDLPGTGGWLDLQVGTGLLTYKYEDKHEWKTMNDIYWRIRWLLYRNLNISLVHSNCKEVESHDVDLTAWINSQAKEELKIETVLGTLKEPSPTALGQLYRTFDRSILTEFNRGEVTTQLERLLVGTVYSNYAGRHNTLSGTTAILPEFGTYTDSNEPGKYLLLSETQRLCADESEIMMVQFDQDNFEGVQFDE